MDDFNASVLSEAKNEYSSRLVTILTPLIIEGIKSIYKEAYDLCNKNDETNKYLMTFQNFLTRIPRWNQQIINEETKRIIQRSRCSYLEDILTCVHITQLKILTSIRVSSHQKKVSIDIPKLPDFIHKVYIELARKLYENVYLFEADTMPLQQQKNMRECEVLCRECILTVVRASMPIEQILRAYIDQDEEEVIIHETVTDPNVQDNKENRSEKELSSDSSGNASLENKQSDVSPNKQVTLATDTSDEKTDISNIKTTNDTLSTDLVATTSSAATPSTATPITTTTTPVAVTPVVTTPATTATPTTATTTETPAVTPAATPVAAVTPVAAATPVAVTTASVEKKSSVSPSNITINTEKADSVSEETVPVLSFSPKDKIMHYKTTDKVTQMKATDSKVVTAPKTLERLEEISQIRHKQRKMEEEEEDDEERLTIHTESAPTLDALDIQVLDSKLELKKPPVLTGVEVL